MIAFAATSALVTGLLTACAGGGHGTLRAALSRFPATMARGALSWDDTAALTALTGKSWRATTKGFSTLRGTGSGSLLPYGRVLEDTAGLSLFDADYSISVGGPPRTVGVVSGGQVSAGLDQLRRWGWRRDGDRMVAPASLADIPADSPAASLVYTMAQVRVVGGDLQYGARSVDLDHVRPAPALRAAPTPGVSLPDGTLDEEPRTAALVDCLGDVVAAQILYKTRVRAATAVAVGVRRPGSATDTPHAVVCASWKSGAAADRYARDVGTALASGTSVRTGEPYSTWLRSPSVSTFGGAQHVVAWQADTPGRANLVVNLFAAADLPGMVDCDGLEARGAPPGVLASHGCR